MFYLHDAARKAAGCSIFITGPGRSGTTLMGKILQSCQMAEYVFEPPLLQSLLPLIHSLTESEFKIIFETYIYEDLFLGQITGRSVNTNRNDDSCIFNAKLESEIKVRQNRPWSKVEAVKNADDRTFVAKLPDMTSYLSVLKKYYPTLKAVVMQRKPNPVINSIIKKGWFSDENLRRRDIYWPSRNEAGLAIPFWVADEDIEKWPRWTEVERAGYYYYRIANAEIPRDSIAISYEKMVSSPKEVIGSLIDKLGLLAGPLTENLISSVHRNSLRNETDWLQKLSINLKEKVEIISLQME